MGDIQDDEAGTQDGTSFAVRTLMRLPSTSSVAHLMAHPPHGQIARTTFCFPSRRSLNA